MSNKSKWMNAGWVRNEEDCGRCEHSQHSVCSEKTEGRDGRSKQARHMQSAVGSVIAVEGTTAEDLGSEMAKTVAGSWASPPAHRPDL